VTTTATEQTPAAQSVVVVRRHDGHAQTGMGIAKGMGVVINHFRKALLKKNEDRNDITGLFTVEYPEQRLALAEAYRNMPILLYDDATGHELCTSCFQCERVCPPQVIHMTQAKDPTTGKPVPAVSEFIVEYDSCMSCGYCAEVCPFDAIKMDHQYELSTADHLSMDVHKAALDRPISYYETLAPTMWAEVRDTALKKLQNNIKRRPGTIGVAPQALGKVNTAAPAAGAATARAAGPAAGAPRAPVAAIGKNMSPEQRAKLEAIRAANRARLGGGGAVEQPADLASGVAAADERHEIQVQVAEEPVQSTGPAAGASGDAASGWSGPVAAIGQNMSAEQRAKLEAIRAANRARREGGS
jgi:NADH-quinone oxidoreductase subunit I